MCLGIMCVIHVHCTIIHRVYYVFSLLQGYSLSDSQSHEQRKAAKAFHGVSLCCNIATLVLYGIYALFFIIMLAVYFSKRKESCYSTCTSHSYYDYSEDSCSDVCY